MIQKSADRIFLLKLHHPAPIRSKMPQLDPPFRVRNRIPIRRNTIHMNGITRADGHSQQAMSQPASQKMGSVGDRFETAGDDRRAHAVSPTMTDRRSNQCGCRVRDKHVPSGPCLLASPPARKFSAVAKVASETRRARCAEHSHAGPATTKPSDSR